MVNFSGLMLSSSSPSPNSSLACVIFSFIFFGLCRKWKILFGKKEKRENVKGGLFFLQDLDAASSSSL